jgi:hypothetical protein
MKLICTALLSLFLAYGIVFAQEATATIDSDVYDSMLDQKSSVTLNNGGLLVQEPTQTIAGDELGSHILLANPPPANNGGSTGWAIFQDLIAGPRWVTITGMTTASTATAGASFTVEFFTRSGTALGGPGGDPSGWTSLGTVPVTQGAGGSTGVSELFATPVISLNPGDTVGVAMLFTGVGPRYFGQGAPPFQVFADTNLTLITGEGRSAPFTTGGSVFASRGLVGEIQYDEFVPVELVSFTASVNDNVVTLNWETATEINNSGFQIEKKSDGDYEAIGFVPGLGTTTEPRSYSFTDAGLQSGNYTYRLKQIDLDGTFEYSDEIQVEVTVPDVFALEQNYPNPFNPSTRIDFSLAVDSKVNLKVFDILGQEVATLINSDLVAGSHNVEFSAVNFNSGVYFYILQTGNYVETKKMVLMK